VAVPTELRALADRVAPVALARDRGLPVVEALQPLVPDAVLTRGSVVGVTGGLGATSLALALAVGASRAGSWTVVVGLPELGLAAAAEMGVVLDRLALVALPPHDPATWAPVLAALVGAVDMVVVDGRLRLRVGEIRRLAARARERGSVLVPVVPGPDVARSPQHPTVGEWTTDLTFSATDARWEGLADGHGYLRRRRVTVVAEGRGRAARARRADLWLPTAGGGVAPAAPASAVAAGAVPGGRGERDTDDVLEAAVARTERFLRSVPAGAQVS